MKPLHCAALALALALLSSVSWGQNDSPMLPLDCVQAYQQIPLDKTDHSLQLDLYVPEKTTNSPPLLVLIHGGADHDRRSKLDAVVFDLTDKGYVVASLDARSSTRTPREQLTDCKGAIRWLWAHAGRYGYDAARIGVIGDSGGAKPAVMLGVTADVDELEGIVAGNLDQSSRVHGVVVLTAANDQSGPIATHTESRDPASGRAARLLEYLTADDAPLLIIEESQHKSVHVLRRLYHHYQEAHLESTVCTLGVVGHDESHFRDAARSAMIQAFFDKHIKQIPRDVFAEDPELSTASRESQVNAAGNILSPIDRRRQRREAAGKRFVAQGVQVGEVVPDLGVYTLAGKPLKLSTLWKHKPAVLVTASMTCPIAYRSCPSLKQVQADYGDAVNVVILYRREAHPNFGDSWSTRTTNAASATVIGATITIAEFWMTSVASLGSVRRFIGGRTVTQALSQSID